MEMMCFQSQWFQVKNGTPGFWKRSSFSRKFVSKLSIENVETFTDCHIKTCRSLKRRAILKIPSTVF